MRRRTLLAGAAAAPIVGGRARAAGDALQVDHGTVFGDVHGATLHGLHRLDDGLLLFGATGDGEAADGLLVAAGPDGTHRWTAVLERETAAVVVHATHAAHGTRVVLRTVDRYGVARTTVATVDRDGAVVGSRGLDDRDADRVVDAARLGDGALLAFAQPVGDQPAALRVDERGRPRAGVRLDPGRRVDPRCVVALPDGRVAVGGRTGGRGWLGVVGPDGRRWGRPLGFGRLAAVRDVHPVDGGFVVCGPRRPVPGERTDDGEPAAGSEAVCGTVTATGQPAWAATLPSRGVGDLVPEAVVPSPAGGFLVAGRRIDGRQRHPFAYVVGEDGDTVATDPVARASPGLGLESLRGVRALAAADGAVLAAGTHEGDTAAPAVLWLGPGGGPLPEQRTLEDMLLVGGGVVGVCGAGWALLRLVERRL